MGALTDYYVDPSIAADSGTGTVGDPYGDLQYALNQITRDATNGDQINLKTGTDEVLAASLTLATYGTPTQAAPLKVKGYSTAADDLDATLTTLGQIDCNANVMFASNYDYVHLQHLDIKGETAGGYGRLVYLGLYAQIVECRVRDHGGTDAMVKTGNYGMVVRCWIDQGTNASYCVELDNDNCKALYNWINLNPSLAYVGIRVKQFSVAHGNIINVGSGGAGIGIDCQSFLSVITNNSILGAGGTGKGIVAAGAACTVLNNLVEGFSGTGGVGILYSGITSLIGANKVYNCATDISATADIHIDLGGDESLGGSPFAKSGANTFANRYTYFAPNDVSDVLGGAIQ